MKRREFIAVACGALIASNRGLAAQQSSAQTMSGPMDGSSHWPVRLDPKPGASPLLTVDDIKVLEAGLKCQCPCSLNVYICHTTDKTCPVSPAMHRDVMSMVNGGHSADEIIEAFVDVYGERVRMAPRAEGFNLVAYIAPFAAVGGAALLVARWITKSLRAQREIEATPAIVAHANATPEELERLQRALRDDA